MWLQVNAFDWVVDGSENVGCDRKENVTLSNLLVPSNGFARSVF
jgi:hypothetical protein